MTQHVDAGLPLAITGVTLQVGDRGGARTVLAVHRLSVAAGACVAICGPSGSGKTTFLNALAGLQPCACGDIRWGEVEVGALRGPAADLWRRRTLGFVFAQFHLLKRCRRSTTSC